MRGCCRRLTGEAPERIVLLGDLLYHGPRNDLPAEYNPKEVISILNGMKERFLCMRGNCDAGGRSDGAGVSDPVGFDGCS